MEDLSHDPEWEYSEQLHLLHHINTHGIDDWDSDNDDLENPIRVNMTYVLKEKSIERPLGWYNPGNCKAEFKRIKTNFTEKNDISKLTEQQVIDEMIKYYTNLRIEQVHKEREDNKKSLELKKSLLLKVKSQSLSIEEEEELKRIIEIHKKSKEPKVKLKVPEVINSDVLNKKLVCDSVNSSEEGIEVTKDEIFESNEAAQPHSNEIVEITDECQVFDTKKSDRSFEKTPKKDDETIKKDSKIKSPIINRHFSDAFCDPEIEVTPVAKIDSPDKTKCTTNLNTHLKQTQMQKLDDVAEENKEAKKLAGGSQNFKKASTSVEKEQSPVHEVFELMSEAPHTEKLTPKSSLEISSPVKISSSPEVSTQPEIVPKIEEESKVVKPVNRQLEFNDEIKEENKPEEINEDLTVLKEEYSTEKEVIKEEPSYDQADTDADTMSTTTTIDADLAHDMPDTKEEHPTQKPTKKRGRKRKHKSSANIKTPARNTTSSFDSHTDDEDKTRKILKQQLITITDQLRSFESSEHFRTPVKDKQAPNYSDVVKNKFDLYTLKKDVEKGEITSWHLYRMKVITIIQNALMYNNSGDDYFLAAKNFLRNARSIVHNEYPQLADEKSESAKRSKRQTAITATEKMKKTADNR